MANPFIRITLTSNQEDAADPSSIIASGTYRVRVFTVADGLVYMYLRESIQYVCFRLHDFLRFVQAWQRSHRQPVRNTTTTTAAVATPSTSSRGLDRRPLRRVYGYPSATPAASTRLRRRLFLSPSLRLSLFLRPSLRQRPHPSLSPSPSPSPKQNQCQSLSLSLSHNRRS